MHICKLNLKFIGLAYSPCKGSDNYNFKTSDLYSCTKCGKLIHRNSVTHSHIYNDMYDKHISYVKECGYRPIGELLKSANLITE